MNLIDTALRQKAMSRTRTLLILALVVATLLTAVVPGPAAIAQEGIVDEESATKEDGATERAGTEDEGTARVAGPAAATGIIGRAAPHSPDPTPVYAITDEATGTAYDLVSGFVDLEQYMGERVTIQGVPVPGPGDPNKPRLLNVTQVEPADEDDGDPPGSVNDKATLSFELTVDGDPPAGAAFYGNVKTGEGGPGLFVPLTDPDGDRVYTGTTTVDRFGPGPRPVPPGVEPVSLPVQIVQDSEVVKDFGTVKLDGDKTFEASVSFPVDDCPIISPTPEQCGDDSGGSDDGDSSGGSDPNGGGSSGSGSSGSSDEGSSGGNSTSGAVDSGSSSIGSSGIAGGLRGVLPSTGGGVALWVLGAGVLLIGGGLLVRRAFR